MYLLLLLIDRLTDLCVIIMKIDRNVLNCNENNVTMQIIIMVLKNFFMQDTIF